MADEADITALLQSWSQGEEAARGRLVEVVYDELRRVAQRHLRHERPDHSLSPTALVHEAYLKLLDQRRVSWHNRAHFFSIAAHVMRRVLIDHARARAAAKRDGGVAVSLEEIDLPIAVSEVDLLALDAPLDKLGRVDADARQRLWLLWPTILANEWHTALMKYRISTDYLGDSAPRWAASEVLHVTAGDEFKTTVDRELERLVGATQLDDRGRQYIEKLRTDAGDKLARRLGWMTRAHPYVLDGNRLIVPLYSDGFSFSLMAITDDWGASWKTSTPVVGFGNIQPSLARKRDGTLVAYMRDNGPPPKRLHVSRSIDRGETWSPAEDSTLPNPGSGAEVRVLANGNWVLVYNDLEQGRYSLAVSLSEDEGATWPWTRHLERSVAGQGAPEAQQRGEYHYPSIIQARDGTLHATYSYFIPPADAAKDEQGRLVRKAIKHAHFNEAWIRAGAVASK